jgi:hypothetical protein
LPCAIATSAVAAASLTAISTGRPNSRWRATSSLTASAIRIGCSACCALLAAQEGEALVDDALHVVRIARQAFPLGVVFKQGEPHAHTRQRRAQVVRQAGEHLAALGVGGGQPVDHGVVLHGKTTHLARPLRLDLARAAVTDRIDRRA